MYFGAFAFSAGCSRDAVLQYGFTELTGEINLEDKPHFTDEDATVQQGDDMAHLGLQHTVS